MAVYEKNALLTRKDEAGDRHLIYPITRLDCVDGAEDLLHYGAAQELTDEEKRQARENIGVAGADLAVNDQDAPGYVANRTHWKEGSEGPLDIQWDGNTEGRVISVEDNGAFFCKVSDHVISDDEFMLCSATHTALNISVNIADIAANEMISVGASTMLLTGILIVRNIEDFVEPESGELMVPETGIYFMYDTASGGHITRLYSDTVTVHTVVYHKLPAEYLPDYLNLPPVTAADAGKMITLVVDDNGNWVREVTDKISVASVEDEILIL